MLLLRLPSSRAKAASRPESRAPRICLFTGVLLFAVSTTALAPAQPPTPPPAAATAAPALAFDVVSIRRNVSGSRQMTRQSASNTDDITMTNVPLALVVLYAYWVNDQNLIANLPDWTWSERYDITAKVSPEELAAYNALTSRQRSAMLQPILADRFQLRVHRQTRDRPVFALVVAKGGPRLTEAQPGEVHPNTAKANPNAFAHGGTIFFTGRGQWTGEAASISDLALSLSNCYAASLGGAVVDKTGLTARYDFTLQIDPSLSLCSGSDTDGGRPDPNDQAAAVASALQQQLGLRLDRSSAPTEYLVVDRIGHATQN